MANGELLRALIARRRANRPPRGQRAPILKSMFQGALAAGKNYIDQNGVPDRFGSLTEMRRRPFGSPSTTRPRNIGGGTMPASPNPGWGMGGGVLSRLARRAQRRSGV